MFTYSFPKTIRFYKSGCLCFLLICLKILLTAIITGIIILKEQDKLKSDFIESSVRIKVVGSFETNFSRDEFKPHISQEEINEYNRVWDPSDYVPYIGVSDVFITTNMIIAPNQTISTCPIFSMNKNISCFDCSPRKRPSHFFTGKCIRQFSFGGKTFDGCEIKGWCPVLRENDFPIINDKALLEAVSESGVYITTSVNFPKLSFKSRNGNEIFDSHYNCTEEKTCWKFNVNEIIKGARVNKKYEDVFKYGAVLSVTIHWNCTISSLWDASMINFFINFQRISLFLFS
jgi:hypothetical protein